MTAVQQKALALIDRCLGIDSQSENDHHEWVLSFIKTRIGRDLDATYLKLLEDMKDMRRPHCGAIKISHLYPEKDEEIWLLIDELIDAESSQLPPHVFSESASYKTVKDYNSNFLGAEAFRRWLTLMCKHHKKNPTLNAFYHTYYEFETYNGSPRPEVQELICASFKSNGAAKLQVYRLYPGDDETNKIAAWHITPG